MLGQTLYLALSALEGTPAPALAPAGLAMGMSWLAKRPASLVRKRSGQRGRRRWNDVADKVSGRGVGS
jgi:hypothetical protein